MERYSVITQKHPREIVLLRGLGCVWRQCAFCDYHLDGGSDAQANAALNATVLARVTGQFGDLEIINSGSFFELDEATQREVHRVCRQKGISELHVEAHARYRDRIPALRRRFSDLTLKLKLGLETFDPVLREQVLRKGVPETTPEAIAQNFDEVNLLVGLSGQTAASMEKDVTLALTYFERVCVNLMCANTTAVRPDPVATEAFLRHVYPLYRDNPRVDVLLHNTDFGVGA